MIFRRCLRIGQPLHPWVFLLLQPLLIQRGCVVVEPSGETRSLGSRVPSETSAGGESSGESDPLRVVRRFSGILSSAGRQGYVCWYVRDSQTSNYKRTHPTSDGAQKLGHFTKLKFGSKRALEFSNLVRLAPIFFYPPAISGIDCLSRPRPPMVSFPRRNNSSCYRRGSASWTRSYQDFSWWGQLALHR